MFARELMLLCGLTESCANAVCCLSSRILSAPVALSGTTYRRWPVVRAHRLLERQYGVLQSGNGLKAKERQGARDEDPRFCVLPGRVGLVNRAFREPLDGIDQRVGHSDRGGRVEDDMKVSPLHRATNPYEARGREVDRVRRTNAGGDRRHASLALAGVHARRPVSMAVMWMVKPSWRATNPCASRVTGTVVVLPS